MAARYFNLWVRAWHILRRNYRQFETDPVVQLKYHRKLVIFWMCNFVPMNTLVGIDVYAILSGNTKLSTLMTAILLAINTNYSLYANWDTETGDAHAAYASVKADQISQEQAIKELPPTPVAVAADVPEPFGF